MPRILTIPRPQAPPLPETGCWLIAAPGFLPAFENCMRVTIHAGEGESAATPTIAP